MFNKYLFTYLKNTLLKQYLPQFEYIKSITGYSSNTMIKVDRESDNPMDTIQSIVWDPFDKTARSFFTCGWDGYVRYYVIEGVSSKKLEKKWEYFFQHPVVSMDITSSKHVVAGLATGHVGIVDTQNINNSGLLGMHEAPICKVVWVEKFEVIMTLGFDNFIKIFSLKQQNNNNFQIGEIPLPAKTNTAAFSFPYLLVGAQDGRIALLNVQKLANMNVKDQYQYIFDQSHGIVKFTASALLAPRGKIALGTADGRIISTTFTQQSYTGSSIRISKPFVGKTQKHQSYRKDILGQINGLEFGIKDSKTQFLIFSGTYECGIFNIEKNMKGKVLLSENSGPAFMAVSISLDSDYYAVGTGMDWCRGIDDVNKQPSKILVGRLSLADLSTMGSSSYMR